MRVNSFVNHLIKSNSETQKQTQVKCNPVIPFKEFSNISEKIELHDVRWKYFSQINIKVVILS